MLGIRHEREYRYGTVHNQGQGKALTPGGSAGRALRSDGLMESRVLDGNAIGGLLLELFGTELTAAPCVCGSCLRGTRGLELG